MKKVWLLVTALAAAVPGAASADTCLRAGYIWNWDVRNDRTLVVEDYDHRKYLVNLMGGCYDLKYDLRLGFKAFGGSRLSCIERGDQVISRGYGVGPQHCVVTQIEPYTHEMEQADRAAMHEAGERRGGY